MWFSQSLANPFNRQNTGHVVSYPEAWSWRGPRFYLLRRQASLYLMDESGTTRAVLGHTKIERPATGVIEQLPASSLVLFDKEAKVEGTVIATVVRMEG